MSFEEQERRSALRTAAALAMEAMEEAGEVERTLSALREEAMATATSATSASSVEVGELLLRLGRAEEALSRPTRAVATMQDLLLGLGVVVVTNGEG